jgi:hypothetical protein
VDQKREFVERILPYRLEAVEIFGLALRYSLAWTAPVPMQIFFDGKLSIDGLSTAFTNAAIEAGIIHCRALLEFIGLRVDPNAHERLIRRPPGRGDDLVIENFSARSRSSLPNRLSRPTAGLLRRQSVLSCA